MLLSDMLPTPVPLAAIARCMYAVLVPSQCRHLILWYPCDKKVGLASEVVPLYVLISTQLLPVKVVR